jgi:hypothetical protein
MNEYYNKNHARRKIMREASNNLLIADAEKYASLGMGKEGRWGLVREWVK